jgi:hypothetical protein
MPKVGASSDFKNFNITDRNIGIEIDVADPKALQKAMGIQKMDCFPIYWGYQDIAIISWSVDFAQKLACKYLVVKCIDIHKKLGFGGGNANNIDMFPLAIEGHTLDIPMTTKRK